MKNIDRLFECAICHEQYPLSLFDNSEPDWDATHLGYGTEILLNHICQMCKTQFKTCTSKCKKTFPAIALYFYRRKKGKYGLYNQCKICRIKESKEEYSRNREKRRAQMKLRYKERKKELESNYNRRRIYHPLIRESDND